MDFFRPEEIERESMRRIAAELEEKGINIPNTIRPIILRVIHTTADFDYARSIYFTEAFDIYDLKYLRNGTITTDTNMAKAGVNQFAANKINCDIRCYMSDQTVAEEAKRRGVTRASVSMERTIAENPHSVIAIGNAPTALLSVAESIDAGARPALVIGVPVGFVNVVESKERAREVCERHGIPAIFSMGRKGGSNVAAAICNALLYSATGTLDPASRG